MELSEAKEAFRNRIECEKITLEKLSKKTPKELLEYEKRQHILEIDDTILEALDNSISKDEVKNLDVIDISGFECVALEDIQELLNKE